MMANIFSVFNPTSSFLSNWLSMMTQLSFMVMTFWLIPSRPQFLAKSLLMGLNREISLLMGPTSFGANILVIAVFLFILFNNSIGYFPMFSHLLDI